MNCIKRDLTFELNLMEQLTGNVECNIGHAKWQLGSVSGEDDVVCVSFDREPLNRVLKNNLYTLDGESFALSTVGNTKDFVIKKSLTTSINPNPLHPKTVTKIFEFMERGVEALSVPMLAVIPINDFPKPSFLHYFGHWVCEGDRLVCSVDSPRAKCCLNGIRFNFRDRSFLVYEYCEDAKSDRRQIVVETECDFSYTEFCECVRRILVVIGFFTGTYYCGPFWIYNAQSHDFVAYNHCMSKGGAVKYHMWSQDPYEYLADADQSPETSKLVEPILKPITRHQFEELLRSLDDKRYAHFFYIFQDISLNMSNLTASAKFPVYAACLEACKEWWVHNNSQQSRLLYTAEQRVEIIQEMEKCLKSHYADCQDTEYLLEKKIKNQSIFRVGNMDELKDAITGVGVDLSEEEIKALSWRNDILHGRDIIKSSFSGDCFADYIEEVELKLFRLHELIWRFIMKSIGYQGVYIDVAKRNRLFREHKSNDGKPLCKYV